MIAKYQLLSNAHFHIVFKTNTCVNFRELYTTKAISYLSPSLTDHHLFFLERFAVQHQKTFGISSG